MTAFVHLLKLFVCACLVFDGAALVVAGAIVAGTVFLIRRGSKGTAVVLLALLLSIVGHAEHVSRKQYVKEVTTIVQQYSQEVANYSANPPAGVMDVAVGLYVARAQWDIFLVDAQLHQYKRHRKATREDVESVLSQLSRDVENTPEPLTSSTDLEN